MVEPITCEATYSGGYPTFVTKVRKIPVFYILQKDFVEKKNALRKIDFIITRKKYLVNIL